MRDVVFAALAALAAAGAFGAAAADTMVIGNGLAHSCAVRTIAGENSPDLLTTCGYALEFELMSPLDTARTYVNRAVVRTRMTDWKGALADLDNAEKRASNLGETYINRGVVLIFQKQYAKAIVETNRGLALTISEPEKAYYNRAIAREHLDDLRGAYEDYRKASELSPTWEMPKADLARFTISSAAKP